MGVDKSEGCGRLFDLREMSRVLEQAFRFNNREMNDGQRFAKVAGSVISFSFMDNCRMKPRTAVQISTA